MSGANGGGTVAVTRSQKRKREEEEANALAVRRQTFFVFGCPRPFILFHDTARRPRKNDSSPWECWVKNRVCFPGGFRVVEIWQHPC